MRLPYSIGAFVPVVLSSNPDPSSNANDIFDWRSSENWFPDHDCVRSKKAGLDLQTKQPVVEWKAWLERLEDTSRSDSVMERSIHELTTLANEGLRKQAVEECPVGLLLSDIFHALYCWERSQGQSEESDVWLCYLAFSGSLQKGLQHLGLRVLMGTRWPVFGLLNSDAWGIAGGVPSTEWGLKLIAEAAALGLDCTGIENPILDWSRFRNLFQGGDWYQDAVDVSYGPELEVSWREAAYECPLGFGVANLIKAMLCAHTESICFRAHAIMIGNMLSDVLPHHIAGSGWPIFLLLSHVSEAVRRHRFQMDFEPHELLAPSLESQNESASMGDIKSKLPALSESAGKSDQAVAGLALRLVYATMVYGSRFNIHIRNFILRATALGINDILVMFCLDAEAYAECRTASGICVQGTPSILNKFTLPLVLLGYGFDVMWIDFDVFLFRSPTGIIEKHLQFEEFDLLVSGSFAVDCICSGIVFFRAVSKTRKWLAHLLSWMYEHPYEHDQKAFSAFLRAGERVAFDDALPITADDMPKWAFFDPEIQFISARHVDVAGWFGDPDDIVVFHFLHGDSDNTKGSNQFAQRVGMGTGYLPLLDLFYNQTDHPELYSTTVLPHHVSPTLKDALWKSRWPEPRPTTPMRCNETVPMRY